jgi:hypothetical protein
MVVLRRNDLLELTKRPMRPHPATEPAYKVVKHKKDRWWEVRDPRVVCVTVYKRGAVEVVRRLAA